MWFDFFKNFDPRWLQSSYRVDGNQDLLINYLNGVQACEYESFLKSHVVTSDVESSKYHVFNYVYTTRYAFNVYLLFADDALEAFVMPLSRFVLHLLHAGPERLAARIAPKIGRIF